MKDKNTSTPLILNKYLEIGGEQKEVRVVMHVEMSPRDDSYIELLVVEAKNLKRIEVLEGEIASESLQKLSAEIKKDFEKTLSEKRFRIGNPPFGHKDITHALPYLGYLITPEVNLYFRTTSLDRKKFNIHGKVFLRTTQRFLDSIIQEGI